MPTFRVPLTTPDGLRVRVRIGLPQAIVTALRIARAPWSV